jgi:pimeloyl-ACP methyl ester carboxylesterase
MSTSRLRSWVEDLEIVVDTLGIDDFVLLGISQGAAGRRGGNAARHPGRVRRLVLFGGFARGWRHWEDRRPDEARTALVKLLSLGWGRSNPAFQQVFTTMFIPDAGPEQMEWFNDLQQISTSPENAARMMDEFARIDVRGLLGEVETPTIVFHTDDDLVIPFDEGRLLAAGIPGARFVPLPSRNHLVLEHEAAWQIMQRELGEFLGWS